MAAWKWMKTGLSTVPASNWPKYDGQKPTAASAIASNARPTYSRRGAAVRTKVAVVAARCSRLRRGRPRVDVERRSGEHLPAVGQVHRARVGDVLLILREEAV